MERNIQKLTPVTAISPPICKKLKYFFTDIDDTLSENGLIPAASLQALYRLSQAGIAVIPVTGRPAGWCDHIARMWPVTAVIGENGAFYFSYDRKARRMHRVYSHEQDTVRRASKKLGRLVKKLLKSFPGVTMAADQKFRLFDAAFDLCEDRAPLSENEREDICHFLERHGACYKISSIHLNVWYGSYDKKTCLFRFLADRTNSKTLPLDRCLYIGDSPNDEPLFAALPNTIAVANLAPYINQIKELPRFITRKPAARGFVEATAIILKKRVGKI